MPAVALVFFRKRTAEPSLCKTRTGLKLSSKMKHS